MKLEYKNILIKKYEDFVVEDIPERKKILRLEIFSILKKLETPDSNDLQIWGLTYYHSNEDKEHNLNWGLQKFLEAYELDAQNFMACLYIAHCYHDQGELKMALNYYNLVDKVALKEFQIWRYVKLIEQIGYCNYKLGYINLGRQLFQEVLSWYRKLPSEDVVNPTEMMQCLPESDDIVIEMQKLEDNL